jgi:hypothetical protein
VVVAVAVEAGDGTCSLAVGTVFSRDCGSEYCRGISPRKY